MIPLPTAIRPVRIERWARRIAAQRVEAIFHPAGQEEGPIEPSPDGLFESSSVVRRVHGDVIAMAVGGISSLLLQMLHPAALAGILDHSDFRRDMMGRLRRTARFLALTTYGPKPQALAAIARVRTIHSAVSGILPDGGRYAADDPGLLAWVHTTAAMSFARAWQRFGGKPLSRAEQDLYFAEFALIGEALGAAPVPRTRADAEQLVADMRAGLAVSGCTRQVANLVLGYRPASPAAMPIHAVLVQAAVDLLPPWARRLHGLESSGLARPLVTAGAFGIAGALRWARAPL